jgi:energy-coupling factor transport system substrate-specific component
MVTLAAVCAAVYAASLIPTQIFPIIPGSTNLRPGNAVAIVLSLLFGPAGAWGAALGNTLNDFFGTLSPATLFGFLGNFLFGLIPYKLWNAWNGGPLPPKGGRGWFLFGAGVLVASAATALVIGWGVHLLGFSPFAPAGVVIFLNNAAFGLVLAPPILAALAPRVRRWGLTYDEILDAEDCRPRPLARPATIVASVAALGGLAAGLVLTSGLSGEGMPEASAVAAAGGPMVFLLAVILVLLLAALFL